jgi:hypothetical protein
VNETGRRLRQVAREVKRWRKRPDGTECASHDSGDRKIFSANDVRRLIRWGG